MKIPINPAWPYHWLWEISRSSKAWKSLSILLGSIIDFGKFQGLAFFPYWNSPLSLTLGNFEAWCFLPIEIPPCYRLWEILESETSSQSKFPMPNQVSQWDDRLGLFGSFAGKAVHWHISLRALTPQRLDHCSAHLHFYVTFHYVSEGAFMPIFRASASINRASCVLVHILVYLCLYVYICSSCTFVHLCPVHLYTWTSVHLYTCTLVHL